MCRREILIRRKMRVQKVTFAVASFVSGGALARVSVHLIHTLSAILARLRFALVNIDYNDDVTYTIT